MSSWSLASAVSPTVSGVASEVIKLTNFQAAVSDIDTETGDKTAKTATTKIINAHPTTPVPAKKLNLKRPPHLTLHTHSSPIAKTKAKQAPLAEAENVALSASSSTDCTSLDIAASTASPASHATANGNSSSNSDSTTASIFPHEQYKTIKKIEIQFENVRFSTKTGFLRRGNKDILLGLTGYFRSGELNVIAGPSGAGKSMLLNLLSGYTPYGFTGDFRINGKPRDLKAFKPNVAFITQDTTLQPFLTVKEAMHFAANLKIGTLMAPAAKRERVLSILTAIGMYENRNTRTGKLSGGQRKRLSIALELVNNPPVLVLDEPTSGLDSSTCNQLIILLKKLAMEGRNVICTIHQPSALTFSMFDHMYAIAEGKCIYSGGTHNLVPFLGGLNMHCPESYNPVDYLMEIATHDYDTDEERQSDKLVAVMDNGRNDDYRQNKSARVAQLATIKKIEKMMAAGLLTPVTAPIMSTGPHSTQAFSFKPMSTIEELSSCINIDDVVYRTEAEEKLMKNKRCSKKMSMPTLELDPARLCKRENIYATPFYRQLNILLLRTFLLNWRDPSLTTMRFGIHLAIGCLTGFLYYGIGNDAKQSRNNVHYIFYAIMFIMYSAFSGILVKFPLEFPIVSREHFNRWYSLRAYYVAITLADLPIQIICSLLFIVPTYLMTSQPMELWRFGMFFLIVIMTALVAQSIGLTVGAALSMQLGAILGPAFICPFLLFSGFFVFEKDAPIYLRWVFDISFLKYSLDGGMLAIFGYDRDRLVCNKFLCSMSHPKLILKTFGMANANFQLAFFSLLGLLIMLRILAFYIMSFRLRLFK